MAESISKLREMLRKKQAEQRPPEAEKQPEQGEVTMMKPLTEDPLKRKKRDKGLDFA